MNISTMYKRTVAPLIAKCLEKKRILLIFGSRQVGKTTSAKYYYDNAVDESKKFLNGDDFEIQEYLGSCSLQRIKELIGDATFLFIDEAQHVPNIGSVLKIIYDSMPEVKIIATGSSAFDLASQSSESLAGRKTVLEMHPLSYQEIYDNNIFTPIPLDRLLIYGTLPEAITRTALPDKEEFLREYVESVLYKDMLSFQKIRKPKLILKLAQIIALQIGNECSITTLARDLGVANYTVESYLDVMEKYYIIYSLPTFQTNKKKELKGKKKYFFWDLGLRNAIIRNFSPLNLRNDVGHLFENFVISNIRIQQIYQYPNATTHFWKDYDKHEIDLIIHNQGELQAIEIKSNSSIKHTAFKHFRTRYPEASTRIVNSDNYHEALISKIRIEN